MYPFNHPFRGLFTAIAILSFASAGALARDLVMFKAPTCATCKLFEREVLPIYASTPAGKTFALYVVDMREKPPFRLHAPVTFTPTFVWVENGEEVGRFAGYYGKDQFFKILSQAARTYHDGGRRKTSALP